MEKKMEKKETTSLLHEKQPFLQTRTFGIILVIISATSFGLSATVVSLASAVPTPLVVASRFLGNIILVAIVCVLKKVNIKVSSENWRVLFFRSLFGLLSFTCGTYAFQHMPVGEATVLISVAPVFVAILSICFLRETITWVKVVAIMLSLTGVVLTVDLPKCLSRNRKELRNGLSLALAVVAALGQALSKASAYIVIRRSNNRVYFLTMVFWYAMFAFSAAALYILIGFFSFWATGRDTSRFIKAILPKEYLYLIVISVLGFISQVALTKGTQMVNTTTVALFRNSDILVTVCFQIFYFHILPSWLQILGMIVVVFSTLLTLLIKEKDEATTGESK